MFYLWTLFWSINGWKGLSSSVTQRQDIGGEAVKMKKKGERTCELLLLASE